MPEITCHKTGQRMSQMVFHHGTIYLPGRLARPRTWSS
jgi:hypothetical protein